MLHYEHTRWSQHQEDHEELLPNNDSIQLSLYSPEFRGTQDIVESQQIVPSLSMQENCFFHMFLIFITILLMRQSKLLTNEEKK